MARRSPLRLGAVGLALVMMASSVSADGPMETTSRGGQGETTRDKGRSYARKYRQALAKTEPARALEEVANLEATAYGSKKGFKALESLRHAEVEVADSLSEFDIESLVPLLDLHMKLYDRYRKERNSALILHAGIVAAVLADRYAEQGPRPAAGKLAAEVIASLGMRQQAAGLVQDGRQLFQQALEHDPKNRVALLGLAVNLEKFDDLRRAVPVLERLVAAHPGFGEGWLRLGINRHRLGRLDKAEEALTLAVDRSAAGWVRSLARQELAYLYLRTERDREAKTTLDQALAEDPDQPGPLLLMAHLHDRQNDQQNALRALSRLQDKEWKPSVRKRYDTWPREPSGARYRLQRSADERWKSMTSVAVSRPR